MPCIKNKDGKIVPFDYSIPECLEHNPNLEVNCMMVYNRLLVYPKGFLFSGEKLIEYMKNIFYNQNPLMIKHKRNSAVKIHPASQ